MKPQETLYTKARQGHLDVIAGLFGLVAALVLLPMQLVLNDVYVRTLPVVLGVASVLYLFTVQNESHGGLPTLSTRLARLLPSFIVLGSALLCLIAGVSGGRTLLFYLIAGTIGTTLLLLILFVDQRQFSPTLLLFLIVLFGLVLRFSALYTSAGYIGVDVWSHMAHWSGEIHTTKSLAPIEGKKYYAAPLYHLLVVGSSLLLDVPIKTALYLTLGVTMVLSTLFIYATATFFVEKRWAVFATGIYAMSASVIEWGIHIIPTSLGLVFFLAVFYCLDRLLRIDYRPRDFGLVVFFSVVVILTHQISSFIMLVFTGAGLVASFALGRGLFDTGRAPKPRSATPQAVNLTGLLVFDLGLITFMWSLTPHQGGSFLAILFSYLSETITNEIGLWNTADKTTIPQGVVPQPTFMDTVVEYLDVVGFLLVLLLTIVGCYFIIRQENVSHATLTSVVATVFMLVFVFGFPILGVRTFVPGRWFAFVVAPMAVVAATGLSYLVHNTNPSVVVVVVVFLVCFPATSVLASDATLDSPPFPDSQTRYSFTESELAAVDAIDAYAGNKSVNWVADHPFTVVINRTRAHNMEIAAMVNGSVAGYTREQRFENGSTTTQLKPATTHIYRAYQQRGSAYVGFFYNNTSVGYTPPATVTDVCGPKTNIIYANDDVVVCDSV